MVVRELEVAERQTREALAIERRHRGDSDLDVLKIESNLALILSEEQKTEESDALYERLVPAWRTAGDQEELATTLNNYGMSLQRRSDYQSALPLLQEALSIRRRIYDPTNSRLAKTMNNVAATLDKVGRLAEAEHLYSQALAINRSLYPDGHGDTVIKLNNLATVRMKQGALKEAELLLVEALEMSEQVETQTLAKIAVRRNLASVRNGLGRFELAEATARDALAFGMPPTLSRLYDVQSVLGAALAGQHRFQEAEDLLVSSYAQLLRMEGPAATFTQEARQRLVDLYEAWGKPEKAAPYREAGDAPAECPPPPCPPPTRPPARCSPRPTAFSRRVRPRPSAAGHCDCTIRRRAGPR